MSNGAIRSLAGGAMVLAVVAIIGLSAAMFTGATERTSTVLLVAPRAGLVMDVDAKVQMRGVTVGRVSDIDYDQPGTATLTLAIHPDDMARIPENVTVRIAAPTVFGAKSVQFIAPEEPAGQGLRDRQMLSAQHVEVEVNTVFGELNEVLGQIRPAELNAALSALSTALSGRGEQFGQMLTDLHGFMREVDPELPALRALLRDSPQMLDVYGDTSAQLLDTVDHASNLSDTLVTEQTRLDAFLTSVIGLSNTGDRVLTDNRRPLARALELLVPTTALTDEYNQALTCSLNGFADLAVSPPADVPGLGLSANFLWGAEPYHAPDDLPKVAATGGPQCSMLPVGFQEKPPYVVADTGANPFDPSRQSVELNVKSLQQALFGPVPDGTPR
ncbi:MCE family protein [Gordonia sp. HNM0687]|uniref:MCE family protein n=1 Tax=Gordonia mangrovi TaxID=2665643 RepID=A0A6L7GTE9_9ACTN|nr:MCE family protein [Gordonia mangrovi]MXP23304.1 MCE family protein [Gordonia mangrovi]UVF76780.1 MCE family protein [Gordonia mangrovi]